MLMFTTVPQQQTATGFEEFWSHYPLHKAKRDAEKAWRQVNGAQHLTAILAAIEAQEAEKKQPGWHPKWPYPASWLRAGRWEDEVALSGRMRLDGRVSEEPCQRCGYPDPTHHSQAFCDQMLSQRCYLPATAETA